MLFDYLYQLTNYLQFVLMLNLSRISRRFLHIKSLNTLPIMARISNKTVFRFTDKKNEKIGEEKPTTDDQSQKELAQSERIFNQFVGLPENTNFRKQIVVARNNYKKSIKELREAILFEDLLKSQLLILIYDTQGKPYYWHLLQSLYIFLVIVGTAFFFKYLISKDPKFEIAFYQTQGGKFFRVLFKFFSIFVFFKIFMRHLRMNKRYVQTIIYQTETQNFKFLRRGFFGQKYTQDISRFKILYTENQALNMRGTNYINIDTMQQYTIGIEYAWKKQDLFSHLISQRIRK